MNATAKALILKARGFALGAHAGMGQVRKFTGEPYHNHPFRAAEMAEAHYCDWEVICGCYLHDTVEDTWVTIKLIHQEFGPVVRRIVEGVTNPATLGNSPDLNRAQRFALNLAHLKEQDHGSKEVRLFDVFDNLRDAEVCDAKFVNMLLDEKPIVLEVCREANYAAYGLCMRRIDEITAHLKARGELK
jgi:(p)ppGpp synthase/HD superfamily hydrolase